jgi:hypothetical protein
VRGVQGSFLPCNPPIIDPSEGFEPTARQVYGPQVEIPVPRNREAVLFVLGAQTFAPAPT